MALDFFAISSQGVYPTPTPTGAKRMALAVSQGLLNIALPSGGIGISRMLMIGMDGIRFMKGIFRMG